MAVSRPIRKPSSSRISIGGISIERRVTADDNLEHREYGYVHLSFGSEAVCGTHGGEIVECIGSIPQRNTTTSCRSESVTPPDDFELIISLVICNATVGWGTGYLESGDIYFMLDEGLHYIGFFPTSEEVADPISDIDFQLETNDRLSADASGVNALLDRCVDIRSRGSVMTRCEKYTISREGAVRSIQGASSFNNSLSTVYRTLVDPNR